MSYLFQKWQKNGGHRLRFREKACGKLPDFEKLVHVSQHVLQGLIAKNIEGESTEANDLSETL